MDSITKLTTKVKLFRDHNAARESQELNKLVELGGLDRAILALEEATKAEA